MDVQQPRVTPNEIEEIAPRIDRPIVLVGMMGVGKSSVGKRLAALLHWSFVDADDEIERSAQMSIPEIFSQFGEDYFRDGERRVIARLMSGDNNRLVIATGGGAFCNPETRALILDRGIGVWLDSDLDTLVERTSRNSNRPLLQHGDPREILGKLRDERRPAYSQAPIHVLSTGGPHINTVSKVIRGIGEWL